MKKHYKNYLMIICLLTLSILSTNAIAQHFNFEGGNPSEPFWTIYIAEATLSSIDLVAGDEIAIFDGETMVGAITLTQICTPENQFDNVLLAFNTLASGNPGYTPGNNALFKCWDTSLGVEISDFDISFVDPYGDAWVQSIFPSNDGEYSIIHLDFEWIHIGSLAGIIYDEINAQPIAGALVEVSGDLSYSGTANANGNYLIEDIEVGIYSVTASAEGYFPKNINGVEILPGETTTLNFVLDPIIKTQTYNLVEGYQLVSSRLISENPDMQNILAGILDNLDFVRNSEGYMLRKIGPNWINNIGDWVTTEGYLFKMNYADSFEINGEAINLIPIELNTGYQLISYLPSEPQDCEEVFTYILNNLEFVRNSAGYMLQKIGPNWINNIGDMQPGEGYLVKMNADDVLTYVPFTNCGDTFIDPRDGQTYNTVQIGVQCWMAKNLNIGEMISGNTNMSNNGVIEKYCYNNETANCEIYGGLYQWSEMMEYTTTQGSQGICPAGWHIPTDDEWKILEGTVDTQYPVGDPIWNNTGYRGFDAGLNLKSISGWYSSGNGFDLYGFYALPGGVCYPIGDFEDLGNNCNWWSSIGHSSGYAWLRSLRYDYDNSARHTNTKVCGYSIRCLKGEGINQPPEPPSSPNPEDGAENQSIESDLSWTCTDPEGDPLTYDIYFGTDDVPPQVATGQTETTYVLETLEYNTEYFWKIVAHDDHSNTTEGSVWSFITEIDQSCPGIPTVTYEGQVYNTVLIGDQCWLKENLNIGEMINSSEDMTGNGIIEKYCYDNDPANCDEYGGLYQWNEMMQYTSMQGTQGICPAGWHIPTDDEWKILEGTVDSQYPVDDPIWNNTGWRGYDAGKNLKSTTGWNQNTGTDVFGFTALPAGDRYAGGGFGGLGSNGYFWSSSENYTYNAWSRNLYYGYDAVLLSNFNKSFGFSSRCLQD
jgi:uncharacterized protein (TIGR02145 family)